MIFFLLQIFFYSSPASFHANKVKFISFFKNVIYFYTPHFIMEHYFLLVLRKQLRITDRYLCF